MTLALRSKLPLAVALALFVLALATAALSVIDHTDAPVDFSAFVCAPKVLAAGADAYRAEPLGRCEAQVLDVLHVRSIPGLVLPAPLPPAALLLLVPFTQLAPGAAITFFSYVIVLATIVCAIATAAVTSDRSGSSAIAIAIAVGSRALQLGNLACVAICGLACSALALRAGKSRTAVLMLLPTVLEPHLELPAVLSLIVFVPKARFWAIALALVQFAPALLLPKMFVEYLTNVLPAHARSELATTIQYSLASALTWAGVSAPVATGVAVAQNALLIGAGLVVASFLRRKFDEPAYLVLCPTAFGIYGGVFVHLTQVAACLPFLFLLWRDLPRLRSLSAATIIIIVLPWSTRSDAALEFVLVTGAGTFLAIALGTSLRLRLAIAVVALVYTLLNVTVAARTPIASPTVPDLRPFDTARDSAERSWTLFANNAYAYRKDPPRELDALLTLLLLGSTLCGCAWLGRHGPSSIKSKNRKAL